MGRVVRATTGDQIGFKATGRDVRDEPQAITEEDVSDPVKLAQILTQMRKDISAARKAANGDWMEFEDVSIASGAQAPLAHHLGGRVRWTLKNRFSNGLTNGLSESTTQSTDDVLILNNDGAGTEIVTVRVEKVSG